MTPRTPRTPRTPGKPTDHPDARPRLGRTIGGSPAWRGLAGIALAAALLSSAGCNAAGALGYLATGERVPAAFELPAKPTLVLVDDPKLKLGNRGAAALAAQQAVHELRRHEVRAPLINPDRIGELGDKLGSGSTGMPIPDVARALGAEQVIYVHVQDAGLASQPGIVQPWAQVMVWVYDLRGRQLFPGGGEVSDGGSAGLNGQAVASTLQYKLSGEVSGSHDAAALRQLAQRVGRDVARLFYTWDRSRPDEKD